MSQNINNKKRVAKNTLFLYMRMLLQLFVSLLTARVMLEALGVEDYGLNNVIAGIVTFFTFLNNSLTSASSRYLTFELGRGDLSSLRIVFRNSFSIHLILAVIVVILGESIGVYMINHILHIPENRLFACHIAYQFVIIGAFISLIQTPFSAIVVSYEKMGLYAYLGIFDVVSKLLICYIVKWVSFDKLITLSILQGLVTFLVFIIYYVYCKRKFGEACCVKVKMEKKLTQSMLKFTIWSLIGSVANILKNQGVNVLINIFFGAAVNAANAIAYRINAAIMGFTGNFTTALNPQITKNYAAKKYGEMNDLIFMGGKYSFFLLMLLGFPIMFEIDFILKLWLGNNNVPEYTSIMTILVIILSMVETFTYTIGCAVQATGNIKYYQLIISGITLMNFPIAYVFYKLGCPPYTALAVSIGISAITLVSRLYFMKKLLYMQPMEYVKKVFGHTFPIALISSTVPILICLNMSDGIVRFFIVVFMSTIMNVVCIWFLGMNVKERTFAKGVVMNYINKKKDAKLAR